ncbi:hypothetical protein Syn7502_03312 [Synechococcus sp. PCC 7502]|uniref:tetratricopeptide repeat protein n=1 Tax=Synechococcus sp. PCC 7502 TaxID=1173263 RepID=UPI00029FF52F|nr:tetratricopeptide repeat protein [Synechococcus sp. PCC 7502]AFY75176.1 hypothetical protein Syn7502_03312 [Synechococcus sp. PCC 7502]
MAFLYSRLIATYVHFRRAIFSIFGNKGDALTKYIRAIDLSLDYLDSGLTKYDSKDYEGAITDLNQAIQICLNHRDAKNELEDYESEIASYDKSKHIFVAAYTLRGNANHILQNYEGAISDFNQAMVLIKSTETEYLQSYLPILHGFEANSRSRLGAYYVSEGRWHEGLEQLQASLDYYRQTDNLERRADVLAQIARVQLLLGDWDKARMLYRDALRLYVHLNKKEGIANCHLALGRMMLRLNYITEAQKELETACNLFRECGLSQRQAETKEVLEVVSQFKSKQAIKL